MDWTAGFNVFKSTGKKIPLVYFYPLLNCSTLHLFTIVSRNSCMFTERGNTVGSRAKLSFAIGVKMNISVCLIQLHLLYIMGWPRFDCSSSS